MPDTRREKLACHKLHLPGIPDKPHHPAAMVDGSMLALVLLAISNGPWEDRAGAMMAAMLDQPGRATAAKLRTYLGSIRVCSCLHSSVRNPFDVLALRFWYGSLCESLDDQAEIGCKISIQLALQMWRF